MTPVLSILTLTIPERAEMLAELTTEVARQRRAARRSTLEHVVVPDLPSFPGETYGEKMRRALLKARGDYVCWIDDDDLPGVGYVEDLVKALSLRPDVVTLTTEWQEGGTTWSFRANWPFDPDLSQRIRTGPAQHFCAWRRDLALSSPWLPYGYGAEVVWASCLNWGHPNLKEVHLSRPILVRRWTRESSRCQRPQDVTPYVRHYGGGMKCWRHRDGRLLASLCGAAERESWEPLVVQDCEGRRLEVPDAEVELLGTAHIN